jgi:enoyl-CoA hydratase/carnithine racemase
MATLPDLLVTDDDGVRTLTLNRPHARNAMTTQLFDDLRGAIAAASADSSVRCVVLTGAGAGFCAGVDLHDFDPARHLVDRETRGALPCIEEIERFRKPLIAAVNGVAVGFGTTALLHCDIVIASTDARFRLPFVHLGLAPEAGSSYLLPLRVGSQEAAHLLFTGSWLDADRAASVGLVWQVVATDELTVVSGNLAHQIASAPMESLIATKRTFLNSRLEPSRAARFHELEVYTRLLRSDEHREAVERFRSKKR